MQAEWSNVASALDALRAQFFAPVLEKYVYITLTDFGIDGLEADLVMKRWHDCGSVVRGLDPWGRRTVRFLP